MPPSENGDSSHPPRPPAPGCRFDHASKDLCEDVVEEANTAGDSSTEWGSTGGGGGGGKPEVFEFYPFLNDVACNEMDGEARCEVWFLSSPDLIFLWTR